MLLLLPLLLAGGTDTADSMQIDQAAPFSSLAVAGVSTLIGGGGWNVSRGDSFLDSDGANRTTLLYRRPYDAAAGAAASPPAARVEVRISTTTYADFPGGLEWMHRLRRAGAAIPPAPILPVPDAARACSVCRGADIVVDAANTVAWWPNATVYGEPGCE
jgi:hypothetical protein